MYLYDVERENNMLWMHSSLKLKRIWWFCQKRVKIRNSEYVSGLETSRYCREQIPKQFPVWFPSRNTSLIALLYEKEPLPPM